jgi:glycosyltransferase involved in cell wall biosynthesis
MEKNVRMKEDSSPYIGIRFKNTPDWTAQTIYISNFLTAIRSFDKDVRFAAVIENSEIKDLPFSQLIDHEVVLPNPFFMKNAPVGFAGKVLKKVWALPEPLIVDRLCKQQAIDVVFGTSLFIPNRIHSVPWVSWIPDFQHLYLKEMFSNKEIKIRNQYFKKMALNSDRIILSSQDCLRDFKILMPEQITKARVVPFVAQIPKDTYEQDPSKIGKVYDLPKKYFFLPNQFWKHKNHTVVINALRILHDNNPEIAVVCSGGEGDYRNQDYFASLLNEISRFNIRNNFIILGVVPFEHVFLLMRQSCAVIQPSLFEGWSTTVEETKSLGKRVILSDIRVHREQNPSGGIFFNPLDPDELAAKLVNVYKDSPSGPDLEMESMAKAKLLERTKEFGRNILEALKFSDETGQ